MWDCSWGHWTKCTRLKPPCWWSWWEELGLEPGLSGLHNQCSRKSSFLPLHCSPEAGRSLLHVTSDPSFHLSHGDNGPAGRFLSSLPRTRRNHPIYHHFGGITPGRLASSALKENFLLALKCPQWHAPSLGHTIIPAHGTGFAHVLPHTTRQPLQTEAPGQDSASPKHLFRVPPAPRAVLSPAVVPAVPRNWLCTHFRG